MVGAGRLRPQHPPTSPAIAIAADYLPSAKMPTLEDVLREGLTVDADVLAGAGYLDRQLSWVVRLRARAPALPPLTGGELVLAPIQALESLDARPALARVVEQVAELGAAAMLVIGRVDREAERVAELHRMPLVQLIASAARPEALELELQGWLVQRKLDIQRELAGLHLEFNSLALAGGFPALLERTVRLTGKPALLQGPDWAIRMRRQPPSGTIPSELVDAALVASRPAAERWARGLVRLPAEPALVRLDLPELHLVHMVAGVRDGSGTGAYVSLVGRAVELGERDTGALLAAAGAGSIELVREHASEAARDAVEGDVLDCLARGDVSDPDALVRRANRLGYDLTEPHLAVALRSTDIDERLIDALPTFVSDRLVLRGQRGDQSLALLATGDSPSARLIGQLREWHQELAAGRRTISVGVGGPGVGPAGLVRALGEASQALVLGQQLFGAGRLAAFADLGIFAFLLRSQSPTSLYEFHASVLGRVAAYDGAKDAELIQTLEAYFASRCSPDATAKRLHLHRNSLLYRLRRIEEIAGVRLDDPETRLLLQLALRIDQILRRGFCAEWPRTAAP
jgi:PucR family transcriptional regulator, purine catabolism regulatory protein